jgi:diguanylate cyclase (GGDEF)-like protein
MIEYKHERYVLDYLCEFRDRGAEADFLEFEKQNSLNIVRFLTLLLGFAFAMFALSDFYYYGNHPAIGLSAGLRIAALFITVAAFSIAGRIDSYARVLLLITLTELAVFAIYLLNLFILDAGNLPLQFMSVMLFILTVFLIPNRWKNSIIAGIIIWTGYVVYAAVFQDRAGSPNAAQRGVYLGICLLSCAVFLYGRESSQRRHFAAEQLLEFISITDRLTGVYNRAHFEYILGLWIKNKRHDPFCLLFFDIDDFKKVNDVHGHNAGDRVLTETAAAVSKSIRDDDVFARWGGEEFVVLFGSTGVERAAELAERLRRAVEAYASDDSMKVTISIGVAGYEREETIPEFVGRADEYMYRAKQAGKNRVVAGDAPAPAGR